MKRYRKLDKKQIIISIILLLNIILITIPYSVKNYNLQNKIKISVMESYQDDMVKYDFFDLYFKFNECIDYMNIQSLSKNAVIENNSLKIEFVLQNDIKKTLNLLTYINQKIPSIKIISSSIKNEDNQSEIVFYLAD